MILPFVQHQKYVTGSATTASIQQRMNSNSGATLLRAYFGIYPLTAYSHNDSFVVSCHTYMDRLRLLRFNLVMQHTGFLMNENLKVPVC